MIAVGKYNQRVTIEARTAVQDAAGQPVDTWSVVATVWADVRYPSGLQAIRAESEVSIVKVSMRIRYRADINAGMRVTHRGTVLDIRAVTPNYSAGYCDLICEAAT